MIRYFAELSFNGEGYHGWQIQPNASSVQETIENALSKLLRQLIKVVGASRTDTGVHAKKYFLHFDIDKKIIPQQLAYKLNRMLPSDIAFHKIFPVNINAHARFDAIERTYKYYIDKYKNPFTINKFASYCPYSLEVKVLNEAAEMLYNFDDFTTFSKTNTDVKNHICKIILAKWEEDGQQYIFTITANRFLRNMVRSLVGTMIDVGREKLSLQDFEKIIQSQDRQNASTSAPACGLFLEEISYPNTI